jgi:hypothetical protein
MKRIGFQVGFLFSLIFALSSSAMATIETVKGTLSCFVGCNRNVVQLIAQGEQHAFEVVGFGVDTSKDVEITGSGVSVSFGTKQSGSVIVNFNVSANAAPGERTVKLRYWVEFSGPDTFKVKVVRVGSISQVRYRRTLPFRTGLGPATPPVELLPATNLPLNQRVILVVTGTGLSNIQVRPESAYPNVRVIPGGTDTSRSIEIEFNSPGQGPLMLFDAALSAPDMRSSTSSRFDYRGGANRNIQYGANQTGGGGAVMPIASPIIGGSVGSSSTFIDVAPRANMLNIFRRSSPNPAFTENGVQYFPINSQHCNGMTGQQSRVITVADPVWGVSNVGTAGITTAFQAELTSGSEVLNTQTVIGLNPGQTRDFTFARQSSRVRVFTFLTHGGCFVSSTGSDFFEDPPFTVEVNTSGTLTEAAANTSNNRRNY